MMLGIVLHASLAAAQDPVRVDAALLPELKHNFDAVAATLASGEVTATTEGIRVRGVTEREADFQAALEGLETAANLAVSTDVVTIDAGKPVALLCRELFVASTRAPIRFQQAGDALRSASYAALDRLADFAAECPEATITIVGHSDSVGDPAFNLDLSRRRAESVARYLVERGVIADQLEVRGAGATEPVADNATSYGRRQNRRIEFSLSMPE